MSKEIQKTGGNELKKSKTGKFNLLNINTTALTASLDILVPPRLFYQLVVFVLDGSGSMTFPGMSNVSKGKEVEKSVNQVIDRLTKSKNKNSFDINVWAYADECVEILPITQLDKIDTLPSLDPTNYIQKYKYTKLKETLNEVSIYADEYLEVNKDKNAQVLIIILSDGAIHDQKESEVICENFKSNSKITISTVLFESKLWKEEYEEDELVFLRENMKNLANNTDLFTSTLDPEEIRKHMIKSISTVSKID
jgi:hypothetical protein